MSANSNPDALSNQGEFRSKVPPSKPMTTKGHAPGVKVGNDLVPEFHAETHPPGTAPPEHTFRPNPINEVPGQAFNPAADESGTRTAANDFPGATSQSVYNATEFGKPAQGQTSAELHGGKRKKERSGLEGVGASVSQAATGGEARSTGQERGEHAERGVRGKAAPEYPGAEGRIPVSSEELAAERA